MLSSRKTSTVVGLDVEAGSIAATEVTSNGEVRLGSTGIAPLGPGVTREGEVADADALAAALKELFAEHKLARNVRIGIANQRVIVRTMRLPLIEDRERVRGRDPLPGGQRDRDAARSGGARLAAARVRAVRHRGQPDGRRRRCGPARDGHGIQRCDPRRRPEADRDRRLRLRDDQGARSEVLPSPPRRRRSPTRNGPPPARTLRSRVRPARLFAASATSPTWPSPAIATACSRGSPPSESRGSPSGSPSDAS